MSSLVADFPALKARLHHPGSLSGLWETVRMEPPHESSYSTKVRNLRKGLHRLRLAQPISRLVNSGGDLAGNIETALRQLRVL